MNYHSSCLYNTSKAQLSLSFILYLLINRGIAITYVYVDVTIYKYIYYINKMICVYCNSKFYRKDNKDGSCHVSTQDNKRHMKRQAEGWLEVGIL